MPGGGEEMRVAKGSLEGTAMRVSGAEVETESLGLGALTGIGSWLGLDSFGGTELVGWDREDRGGRV